MVLDLRAVERTLARQLLPLDATARQRRAQRTFGLVPGGIVTQARLRTQRDLDLDVVETERFVHRQRLLMERGHFRLDLAFRAEDVAIILRETTHAQNAVQRTGRLIAVARTELAITNRQVAVAVQALVEHLHVARAVHRLQRIGALFRFSEEHVVLVVVPVTGLLPQAHVQDLRAAHFAVTAVAIDLAHVLLDNLPDRPALRMPEHQARRFFLQMEKILLLADAAVIAHFGFFDALDVGLKLLLVGPRGAINALQLLVLGIATPVRTGDTRQLERLQKTRVRHVRTAAHVHVFLVVVHAHRGDVFGHVFDQAQLVVLATRLEDFNHFRTWRHLLDDVVIGRDQLRHALLDRHHVVRRERALAVDVVVETFGDDRADHHLGVRVQLLDRMAHQMRARVTDDLHALFVLGGDDAQRSIVVDHVAGIDLHAIHDTRDGGLGQTGADGLGHVHDADRIFELTDAAVRESDVDHGNSPEVMAGFRRGMTGSSGQ
ncbi:hypothetical protein D3C81_1025190 [compost metagenome]